MKAHRRHARVAAALVVSLIGSSAKPVWSAPDTPAKETPAPPETAPAPPPADTQGELGRDEREERRSEARRHFEKGVALVDSGAYEAALLEFLVSRKIHLSRGATRNAALCLRHLGRFDEALDLFEELLAIPDLPAAEREEFQSEVVSLRGLVAMVNIECPEFGASITIDGRNRGVAPLATPVRVSPGQRVVRVSKAGFAPFEARLELLSGQTVPLRVNLVPLAESGWLVVRESSGWVVDVVVDGADVGRTPWKGRVRSGGHVVFLRGDGVLGAQPAAVTVRLNQVSEIVLLAEPLEARLEIEPSPRNARVKLDGVPLGPGPWKGAVRADRHQIEVAAEGFFPQVRELHLGANERTTVHVALEVNTGGPRPFAEGAVGVGLWPTLGGDLAAGCQAGCTSSLGAGPLLRARAGLQWPSAAALALEVGYLQAGFALTDRATSALPTGLDPNPGRTTDWLTLRGALLGASAGARFGGRLSLGVSLGAGALLGALEDQRSGTFSTRARSVYTAYARQSRPVQALYIAPELRIGYRLGNRIWLDAFAQALLLVVPAPPRWAPEQGYFDAASDGQGRFASDTLTSSAVFTFVPGVGAHYEF